MVNRLPIFIFTFDPIASLGYYSMRGLLGIWGDDMGRKKLDEPTLDPHGRVTIVNLKGPINDREYLDRLNRKTGVPVATIVRRGIALWAAKHGHEIAPEAWLEDPPDAPATSETTPASKAKLKSKSG